MDFVNLHYAVPCLKVVSEFTCAFGTAVREQVTQPSHALTCMNFCEASAVLRVS